MDAQTWMLFVSLAFIATLTPGPAVLLATSHAISHGWRKAIFTALGNISGLFVMSALSAAGLSIIILNSAVMFAIIKFLGALYLIYLGIKIWQKGLLQLGRSGRANLQPLSWTSLYLQGLAVSLGNPKAIVFTTALFPQFISPEGSLTYQFSLLVATLMALSFFCLVGYAYSAHRLGGTLFKVAPIWLNRAFGAGFVTAGMVLANVTRNRAYE